MDDINHKTKYIGIWVVEDRRDSGTRYFLQDDNGHDHFCGYAYPTDRQINRFRDERF